MEHSENGYDSKSSTNCVNFIWEIISRMTYCECTISEFLKFEMDEIISLDLKNSIF